MQLNVLAALISTGFISFAPSILLVLYPNIDVNNDTSSSSLLLSCGRALAAGGLLGDVFLHELPHAFEGGGGGHGHSHGHGHDHHHHHHDEYDGEHHTHGGDDIGVMILVGFTVFLAFDMMMRSLNNDGHHHCHRHGQDRVASYDDNTNNSNKSRNKMSSTVILNLAADALHNFTDGLAIGVSFASVNTTATTTDDDNSSIISSLFELFRSRGGVASLSVLCHEIPHEIGDVSILMSQGYSKWEAIIVQAFTAISAFLGTICGLLVFHVEGIGHALLPFTSGGFVYLAAVSILPELLEQIHQSMKHRLYILFSFVIGIAFLYWVAILEHAEHSHDHKSYHHDHQQHSSHDAHDHHGVHHYEL